MVQNFNLALRDILALSKSFCLLIILFLLACQAKEIAAQDKYNNLGLIAYNYTDHHISDYSVNSIGGGNVSKYSKSSGAGGITCCFKLTSRTLDPITVKVRWQHGGCIYVLRNDLTNETADVTHYYYKERKVLAVRLDVNDPRYLETHFYADGSVQVQIADSISGPKFEGKDNRNEKRSFPRCKNDKKPE